MAITFKEFYNEFKMLCEKYNPYVVVWGKSDITSLKKTCQINNVPELNLRFVNLLQLHTNYDNLKNSPGLFSMWEAYNNTKLPEQRHDSLEDAMVTKDVFFKFKEKVNG
jgi:sporulation inhibitor KapD